MSLISDLLLIPIEFNLLFPVMDQVLRLNYLEMAKYKRGYLCWNIYM